MKSVLSAFLMLVTLTVSAQKIPSYFKSSQELGDLNSAVNEVKSNIISSGFKVIGEYSPADNANFKVIAFTSDNLKKLATEFSDRGALGAVLRIGLIEKGGKTTISIANPIYMFNAYWGTKASSSQKQKMNSISKKAVKILGTSIIPFGGEMDAEDLAEYHYKMMMPYFTDPIELADYSSFDIGKKTIEANINSGKGNTKLVYKLTFPGKDIVVYGIALKGDNGEKDFLPKIGEDHLAAMPYEIILQGKEATMLHGKYRLALYWPNLTMGQFMKIMNTPGNIEDALEAICK